MKLAVLALVASSLIGAGCAAPVSGEGERTARPAPRAEGRPTYVAIGASETVGFGAGDPGSQGWPTVFAERALPTDVELVNLGVVGATVPEALRIELPKAEAAEPDLVTVWLNANDILRGVPLSQYRSDLDSLLGSLRATGAEILVANTPPLAELPAVLACQPDPPPGPPCLFGAEWPPPNLLEDRVDRFNEVIRTVSARNEATVVDLYGAAFRRAGMNTLIARDGFHPSTRGHAAVAAQFAKTLRRQDITLD